MTTADLRATGPRRRPVVFLFSGQGSQYYQMGRSLFEAQPVFREWMMRAEECVRQWQGRSLIDEVYSPTRGKSDVFRELRYTHPAIYAVEYATFQTLRHLGVTPEYLLGASLGELVAAAASGVISFEQGLEMVCRQVELLETQCPNSGGMLAILAPVTLFETDPLLRATTTVAGLNFSSHFMVSGTAPNLDAVEQRFKALGVTFVRLPVSHAFHAPPIDAIERGYREVLERQTYRAPRIPVIFCSAAGPVDVVSADVLWRSVRGPIRLQETMAALEATGAHLYIDAGPSGTMATLAKYNLAPGSRSTTVPLLTPFGRERESLEKIRAMVEAETRQAR